MTLRLISFAGRRVEMEGRVKMWVRGLARLGRVYKAAVNAGPQSLFPSTASHTHHGKSLARARSVRVPSYQDRSLATSLSFRYVCHLSDRPRRLCR
jgi:hypothetical protein